MTIFLGIDDTDSLESVGTGRLAREIASLLARQYPVRCVTRHQFFVHPDIPYTSHNSGAVIHLEDISDEFLDDLFDSVRIMMQKWFVDGSDPGLALARSDLITAPVITFGQDAKRIVLTLEQAWTLARNSGIMLEGLGGTDGGVIGALAGIGLAATGYDGRYLQIGSIRDHPGDQSVEDLKRAGVDLVMTIDGRVVTEGLIRIRKFPQPVCIGARPVLLVEEYEGELVLVKRE
ncbi:MAG TPA: ABC transporter substrate-binding protein [Methanospirillum sp.]|nr:ABC transporter substrate-binding protein [Methanospirillum sp.]